MTLFSCSKNRYMGFGFSGSSTHTSMVGADATIAWVDNDMGRPYALDYFLSQRTQVSSLDMQS